MDVRKSNGGMERILTHRWVRVLKPEKNGKWSKSREEEDYLDGVYALGTSLVLMEILCLQQPKSLCEK